MRLRRRPSLASPCPSSYRLLVVESLHVGVLPESILDPSAPPLHILHQALSELFWVLKDGPQKDVSRWQQLGLLELAVSLAKLAGLVPSVVFAEMLNEGSSISFNEAKRFAKERGLTL